MTARPRSKRDFVERYGPAALVTGAAQGIGLAFAERLAARGLSIYMLDVQREPLEEAARDLSDRYDVSTWALPSDLAERDFLHGVEAVIARTGVDVGLVVCNAALGLEGPFLEASLETMHRAVEIACQSTLTLAHHFGRAMVERRRGGLIFLASGTALQGSPGFSSYAATKAFNLVLGESLWYELREHGVDVLSYVPGPTNTPGMRKSLPQLREGEEVGPIKLPEATAENAIRALGQRASAAREREQASRLSGRRRAADEFFARQQERGGWSGASGEDR
jgi:short-subunit dehydrogenase